MTKLYIHPVKKPASQYLKNLDEDIAILNVQTHEENHFDLRNLK
jgi:hypothetical protein